MHGGGEVRIWVGTVATGPEQHVAETETQVCVLTWSHTYVAKK